MKIILTVLKNRIFRKFEWSTWKLLDFRILLQIPQTPCRKSTSLREVRDRYASRRTPLWKFLPTGLHIIQIYITNLFIYIWIFRKIDIQLKSLCFIYIGVLITSFNIHVYICLQTIKRQMWLLPLSSMIQHGLEYDIHQYTICKCKKRMTPVSACPK